MTEKLDKKTYLFDLLHEGLRKPQGHGIVAILVDTRHPGVKVPKNLEGKVGVKFNLSLRFAPPPRLMDHSVEATLSFQGQPFDCVFPWESIFAIHAGEAKMDPAVPKKPAFQLIKGGLDD